MDNVVQLKEVARPGDTPAETVRRLAADIEANPGEIESVLVIALKPHAAVFYCSAMTPMEANWMADEAKDFARDPDAWE